MNPRSSSYTGRAPRNLQDAFGPYTSRQIHEPAPRAHPAEVVLYVVLAPLVVAFLIAIWAGWLS